jgi:hypothetical protein
VLSDLQMPYFVGRILTFVDQEGNHGGNGGSAVSTSILVGNA